MNYKWEIITGNFGCASVESHLRYMLMELISPEYSISVILNFMK